MTKGDVSWLIAVAPNVHFAVVQYFNTRGRQKWAVEEQEYIGEQWITVQKHGAYNLCVQAFMKLSVLLEQWVTPGEINWEI